MILTAPFNTPAAIAEFFNTPANAALRLVSVLPPDGSTDYLAVYEADAPPTGEDLIAQEEARLRRLEERFVALAHAPADRKAGMNFPRSIINTVQVPVSILANRLRPLAAFRNMTMPDLVEWIQDNLDAVGCAYVSAEEAREKHGCTVELAMFGV